MAPGRPTRPTVGIEPSAPFFRRGDGRNSSPIRLPDDCKFSGIVDNGAVSTSGLSTLEAISP